MKISEKDVLYVAELANLELTPEEREGMVRDLSSILSYVDHLNELDTSKVPAMAQVSSEGTRSPAALADSDFNYAQRDDVQRVCLPHEEAMKNAPGSEGEFFKVPKVIER